MMRRIGGGPAALWPKLAESLRGSASWSCAAGDHVAQFEFSSSSSAATKELTKLFQQATEILTDRVDGLMVAFKTSEPVFFSEYEAARVTLRTGRRSGSNVSEVEVEAAPVETPVAKAA
jgi:hypothetical protein